jgi:hypothetical protein
MAGLACFMLRLFKVRRKSTMARQAMRALCVAALVALTSAAAHAQSNMSPVAGAGKTPEQIAKEKKAEQAYKESLKNIPDKEDKDPWSGVRGGDAAKPAASPVKPARTVAKRTTPPQGAAAPTTQQ